ncbi:MAG: ABC transporter permease [Candidatus Promineifilaceae bacterium]|jgi:ABC-2 type transport system permease protein
MNQFLIQVSSFVRKEVAEIIRQPRLVATLILGPFLILLIFGIGYNDSFRTMRTVMVIPEDSKIKEEIQEIANSLQGAVELVGFVSTQQEARQMLEDREADLVLVTPADPFGDIQEGKQSEMEMIHNEIDPIEEMFVNTLESAYVEEVNRLVWVRTLDRAKAEGQAVLEKVQQTQDDATELRRDLQSGDGEKSAAGIARLITDFQEIDLALSTSLATFEGIQSMSDEEAFGSPFQRLDDAERTVDELKAFDPNKDNYNQEIVLVTSLQQQLKLMDDFLSRLIELNSRVLARPFTGKTAQLSDIDFGPIDFYVPGVISLLLQHIAITLASLSIVRERVGGSIELFRAAPVTSFQTLVGKTISFLIFGGVLAAVLTLLVVLLLRVPMLGSWLWYVVIVLALLYTSLGMGFAISTISQTDSQAVQYSMIVLLASIFFSGFFIALHRLLTGVHIVSWLLPATYGTAMLQDLMLRGMQPKPLLLGGLIVFGLLLYTFAWWRLRRLMARE